MVDQAQASEAETLASGNRPTQPRGSEREAGELARGTTLGRYIVVSKLGAGGMGVVYGAYDPELDRRVAVKLLDSSVTETGAGAKARLLHEAQAMAKLSHPNVLAVHDVGTLDRRVFIAVEYIAGGTLTQWLRSARRTWPEIVAMFTQAGRGLAAAHAASITHRDFKPDNVLMTEDGVAKVADFGLACGPTPIDAHSGDAAGGTLLGGHPTATGTVMGTPYFMSPEQFQGEDVGPRSDQFSFCAALFFALYGTRPFEGDDLYALRRAVIEGAVIELPRGHRVPTRIGKLLLVGLLPDPKQRHASMEVLVAALDRASAARRRRTIAASVTTAAIAVFAAGTVASGGTEQPCSGAAGRLRGVWDASRRDEVRTAMLATAHPYAADVWASVRSQLDDYAQRWTAMHTEACQATRVRGEQSQRVLEQRMLCLERRIRPLAALTEALAQTDEASLVHAVAASNGLPPIPTCGDLEALSTMVRPPRDADTRRRVDGLRARLDSANALRSMGRYPAGLGVAAAALGDARTLDYPPIVAQCLLATARLHAATGDKDTAQELLFEALQTATEARHDAVFVAAAARILTISDGSQEHQREMDHVYALAQATLRRRSTPAQRVQLLFGYMRTLRKRGDVQGALRTGHRALEISLATEAPDAYRVGAAWHALGVAHHAVGNVAAAIDDFERAYAIRMRFGGIDHPDNIEVLNAIASMRGMQDDAKGAEKIFRSLLARYEETLGREHPKVATTLLNLGGVLVDQGKHQEATELTMRGLAITRRHHAPQSPEVAAFIGNLAIIDEAAGRLDDARANAEQCQAILERAYGPRHPMLATILLVRGRVDRKQGRYSEALAHFERAAEVAGDVLDPGARVRVNVLEEMAQVHLARGDATRAEALLAPVVQYVDSSRTGPVNTSRFLSTYAKAVAGGGDPRRAADIARRAIEALDETGHETPERAAIVRWLTTITP